MLTKSKKHITLLLLVILTITFLTFSLSGCKRAEKTEEMYLDYTDLASSATFYKGDKQVNNFKISGNKAEKKGITVDLQEPKKFNTIVLGENSKGVTKFDIFASNDKDFKTFKLIYSGDTIEYFRLCFLGDVQYRYIHIDVTESTDVYDVNSIKVYNNKNENVEKRVVSYFLIDRVDTTDLNALNTVTDIILFSWMRFDKDGNINILVDNADFTDYLPKAEAEQKYQENLNKLKSKVAEIEAAQNRHINLIPCILMPQSDDPNDNNKYANYMMENNVFEAANNVKAFIEKYGFDGVDFDFEYPYKKKEHKIFDKFLITVKDTIGKDKILSAALADWNIDMSTDAINALDQVQLMTYDLFDTHGYHAAFYPCMVNGLNKAIKKGIPAEKINVGLPFYSRPLSRAGYWGDYFRFFEDDLAVINSKNPTAKYVNKVTFPAIDMQGNPINEIEYFNGYQMIQDKTAFCIDCPAAGVMIWHMNCDTNYSNELSLFKAINETIKSKGATLKENR